MHTTPQAPQFFASALRSCSQPLSTLPSQSPKPPLHLPMPHEPPRQPGDPFITGGQRLLQPPQLLASAIASDSQPSPGFLLQSPKPGLQLSTTQLPAAQATVAELGSGGQVLPQAPQFM